MSARELLLQLREKGVDVKANGDRLVIDAPRGAITPDLRDALSANKAELLQILNAPPIERAAPKPAPVAAQEPLAPPAPAAVKREASLRSWEPEPMSPEASSVVEEIKQLEVELNRLHTEEEARRAEFETARLAAEHAFNQASQGWRQDQEAAARRRAEHEKLRIEAEARERAAEETRRRIAETELARVEEELKRMRAMEDARRAEVEAQFASAEAARQNELEQARHVEAEQSRTRGEEERRFLEGEARKRAQEDEMRRRAQTRIAAVEEEILRLRLREDARVKSAEEAHLLAEETQRRRAEEEARRQAEAEAQRRAEEEARLRAEIEAQMRAEAEAKRKAEEEAQKQAEAEARRRAQEETERLAAEQARLAAEQEDRRRAEDEERRLIEEERRRQAEVEERLRAEEATRSRAEEDARKRAEAEVRQRAELEARIRTEVEAKLRAEEEERQALLEEREREHYAQRVPEEIKTSQFLGGEESEFQPVSVPEASSDSDAASSATRGQDARGRASALHNLSGMETEDAFEQITEAFDDPSSEVRNAAAQALFDFQEDRAAAFTRALRDSPAERRARIGAAIATSGLADEAINNLTGESRDKTYDAFSLLFLMSKSGEINPLMRAIEAHPSTEVRLAVVKLLALSGQPDVLPAFRRMAVRGTLPPEVRSAVMEAIYQVGSQTPGEGQPTA
jgi:hypothetical protein